MVRTFTVESAIRCGRCGQIGCICVYPQVKLSDDELKAQRLANPDPVIVGLKTAALCASCRTDIRHTEKLEVIPAADFIAMKNRQLGTGLVNQGPAVPVNQTLAALNRRFIKPR